LRLELPGGSTRVPLRSFVIASCECGLRGGQQKLRVLYRRQA
jgi:hypothetical protein